VSSERAQGYVPARTPVEQTLVEIWSEVLGVERVGVYGNFFELGGHSLLATQAIARIRKVFQVELSLRRIFESPTAAALATIIDTEIGADLSALIPPPQPVQREGAIPLSFAQQRLWLINQLEDDDCAYNVPVAVRLEGELDLSSLERALSEILRRHEALRTTFSQVDGRGVQIIREPEAVRLSTTDLSGTPAAEREAVAQDLLTKETQRPFDLEQGPLTRIKLFRLGAKEHVMVVTMHHIVTDGWSIGVLLRELGTLYQAFAEGRPSPLAELPIQYADYACWQRRWMRGEALESQLKYWKRQLQGAPAALELPTDRPRPARQRFKGALRSLTLEPELSQALQALSRERGVTLYMTLLAAFQTLLHRYTGQTDVLVGTPTANRTRAETEELIGFFVNTLVLRADLSDDPGFSQLLDRVRETTLGAYAHQDLPFEKLVEELQPERDLSRTPLFQVMFVLQNMSLSVPEMNGLKASPAVVDTGAAKFDLTLALMETAQGLGTWIEYNTDLFDEGTINRTLGHYRTLLESVAAKPGERLSNLALLTEAERRQLVWEWNETARDCPQDEGLARLFESQAERRADAIAVAFGQEQLSYRELNRRAGRLARRLRVLGVEPESVVALLADRGIDFLIAVLGVFKAGGAYLPLDPRHPVERIGQMIGLSGAGLVIASCGYGAQAAQAVAGPSAEPPPPLLLLEELLQGRHPEEELGVDFHSRRLAYVIFTSGSTGVPKGAMVEQRGMLNHLHAKIWEMSLNEGDVVAQNASQCFDISVWQFLAALLVGGRVQIFNDEIAHDPAGLPDQAELRQVTILEIVPSMLRAMLTEAADRRAKAKLTALRRLILTGEALPPDLCREWLRLYPEIPLLNAYGPTECSDDVTHHSIFGAPSEGRLRMPIGRPIVNTQVHVLNTGFEPQPVGVIGELYIAGVGVGRGYLDDAGKTAEKFLPAPFGIEAGARVYRSGDLALHLPDGGLEYLGRIDHQVKIRGYRIEVGEIEAVLRSHPSVEEAAVTTGEETSAEKGLVAYLVGGDGRTISISEVRSYLKRK
ncbi:MAG TPA: amino acid adenylation domain-containing protein, partial [Blastocatellia bacterium]|nr:amino acid adenylation domain-containing protein [Blastocatellia bacterium]